MKSGGRIIFTAVFAAFLTVVVGAGLSWACTGPTFGTPATPGTPPAPSPEGNAPVPTTPASAQGVAAPVAEPSPTGATQTSGARAKTTSGARGDSGSRAPRNTGSGRRTTTVSPVANRVAATQFTQRARGETAGITRSGGRAVFGAPAAKVSKSREADKPERAAPSARSASGDLWKGFKPQTRSSVFAAEASGGTQAGGAPLSAALLVLGLGLAGALASASVLGLRRRKAKATAGSANSSTRPTK